MAYSRNERRGTRALLTIRRAYSTETDETGPDRAGERGATMWSGEKRSKAAETDGAENDRGQS
ncbi:uncharacterized protein LOC143207990 isoform X2 [Lasioglossum baleicum]|uniref:uncharacterized protein LOC143207990 isoform X2 n=1 Tax=Lasioglossum baleicum TaxID=434251 RepID=UPI003FCCDFCF